MRFMAFKKDGAAGLAAQVDGTWRGAPGQETLQFGSIRDLISGGKKALAEAYAHFSKLPEIDVSTVDVLPPIDNASKIICVGLNYADHTEESGYKQPEHPTLFARFNSSLVGAGSPIVRPLISEALDFEGELVAVIGEGGRDIRKPDALNHVIGYSIFNDGSIRDYQHQTPQWTLGKNFDGTGAFGPFFVTADELPQGANGLHIETRLNGQVVQVSNTSKLIFDVATLVSKISEAITLEPGDLIVTGTPSGIGHARTPRLYMKAGDHVEVEIEGIGILTNPIIDQVAVAQREAV